jgi:hypothetical protein
VDVGGRGIGVGLVGYRFMGRAHSNAYRQVARFFDLELAPRMRAICGRDEAGTKDAAASLGWEGYETDYRRLLERDDIDLVDIASQAPTFEDSYRCQAVLDAAERSVESRAWTEPVGIGAPAV